MRPAGQGGTLVVVGTLHLLGSDGVVEKLRAKGYKVERVCTACKACVSACHSLNGLDDDEIWRNVGTIYGGTPSEPYQQTVTTACHHCVEPGCLEGCPVMAYEKDKATGIVRHLDDQCIGCEYCLLKCPYDVPKYSSRRGIVRKCDMCYHRLAADDVAGGSLLRPFGELEVPLGPSYWIVRPQAKPRAAVAAVIDWLHWQAAGSRRPAR